MNVRNRPTNCFGGKAGALLAGLLLGLVSSQFTAMAFDAQSVASANNGFAFGLVKELVKAKPGENVFVSPYSISAALQMVRAGAAGETKTEMDQVLGSGGPDIRALAQAYKDLDQSITTGASNAVLSIANAIWYAPNIQLKPEFASLNKDFYGATLSALDFTDPRASGRVNAWVNEQTRGKITRIVEGPLSGMTGAMLANAIYFKGTWEKKFEPRETQDRVFNLAYGQQKSLPMLHQKGEFLYEEAEGFQAVSLPYSSSRLAMCVLLPKAGSSPQKLLATMNHELWTNSVMSKLSRKEGVLMLPRFKLEYSAELRHPLATMGMKRAFTPAVADFSAMSSTRLFVSAVKHKSFVEVNEDGTEAAAVTGVIVNTAAVKVDHPPFQMTVDRPFLFVIEDVPTHTILFFGVVHDPAAN